VRIDNDTAQTLQRGRASIGSLLRTAQLKLQRVFVAFLIGMLASILAMRRVVWPTLEADLLPTGTSIIAQTPFEVILLQVKIGIIIGVLVAVPVLLYYAREPLAEYGVIQNVPVSRGNAAVVVLTMILLFIGGALYAYNLFFPIMLSFLASNAIRAGFTPMYGIVHWTQFLLVMLLSFGMAAQLPLVMTALSYSGIVPYETFRDKWKYAIVMIFGFGAVFSPPDPFTQLMWALPLALLYGVSLYLSKIVVTFKRGHDRIDLRAEILGRSKQLIGGALAASVLVTAAIQAGARGVLNETVIPAVPSSVRPPTIAPVSDLLGLPHRQALAAIGGSVFVLAGVVLLLATVWRLVSRTASALASEGQLGDPAAIDLSTLDETGVRSAPPEAFDALSEQDALADASAAKDAGRSGAASAILERFDAAQERAEAEDGEDETERAVKETTTGMVDAFTEEETTEDDVGGYFWDLKFIFDSVVSSMFKIVAVFLLVLSGTFYWLYSGGIGTVREDFTSRLPEAAVSDDALRIVTLHPVEALLFEVKVSVLIAVFAIIPLVLYSAWPALKERSFVGGRRETIIVWAAAMVAGFAIGIYVGYAYISPGLISWLVWDAQQANMVIAYRVKNFFWLIVLTTVGVGVFANIPVSMLLFYFGDLLTFHQMRRAWRGIAVLSFVVAALITPDTVYTMLIVAVPIVISYLFGLGLLWLLTLGGRRESPPPEPTLSSD